MRLKCISLFMMLMCQVSFVLAQEADPKSPENFLVTIARKKVNDSGCIKGNLFINGLPRCEFFETADGKISLPPGEYIAVFKKDAANKKVILNIVESKTKITISQSISSDKNHIVLAETVNNCGSVTPKNSAKGFSEAMKAFDAGVFTDGQRVSLSISALPE